MCACMNRNGLVLLFSDTRHIWEMKRKRNRRERERRVARSIYPLIHPNGIGPLVRLVPTAALLSVTNFIPLLGLHKSSPQTYHTFHLSHFFVHSPLSSLSTSFAIHHTALPRSLFPLSILSFLSFSFPFHSSTPPLFSLTFSPHSPHFWLPLSLSLSLSRSKGSTNVPHDNKMNICMHPDWPLSLAI